MTSTMKSALLLFALIGGASAASAQTFAIRCHGTDFSDETTTGVVVSSKNALDWQTYVIDADGRHVSRAVAAQRALVDLCDLTRPSCEVNAAQDMVQVHGNADRDGFKTSVSFEYNRASNAALHEVNVDYDDGRYVHIRWQMNCEKTGIPTFDK